MKADRAARRAAKEHTTEARRRDVPDGVRAFAVAVLLLACLGYARGGLWSTLALAVLVVHLAYLVYVLVGGFLAVRHPNLIWPHLAASTWGIVGAVWALPCPLTLLEKWALEQGGRHAYPGTFIGHYLDGTVWPTGQASEVWQLTALTVVASYVVALRRVARQPART